MVTAAGGKIAQPETDDEREARLDREDVFKEKWRRGELRHLRPGDPGVTSIGLSGIPGGGSLPDKPNFLPPEPPSPVEQMRQAAQASAQAPPELSTATKDFIARMSQLAATQENPDL